MKKAFLVLLFIPFLLQSQQAIVIDHTCINLTDIPDQWITKAKDNLFIAYGHTSHGSQLTTGMDAIEAYYSGGKYNWSHSGGTGELHLFEGAGYATGYLELDCGYSGWDIQTRIYLDDFPDCNVMLWSWCGQVNSVNLQTHYFQPMAQLELDYPNVKFVYMTGHLEGLGPLGSVYHANQEIRDYCVANNKTLFDFADIEKYSPDDDTNYQDHYADDACDYQIQGGGTANWAINWLNNNTTHQLTNISNLCGSCAHSVSLNCVKKGIACWYLWARLAGWDGQTTGVTEKEFLEINLFPNPVKSVLNIEIKDSQKETKLEIWNIDASQAYSRSIITSDTKLKINICKLPPGVYVICVENGNRIWNQRFIKL